MTKTLAIIARIKLEINDARKALVVGVPAVGLIVGTDNPYYQKAIAVLVALGVYVVENKAKAAK